MPAAVLLVVESGAVAVMCDSGLTRRMVVAVAVAGGVLAVPSRDQRLVALDDAALRALTVEAWQSLLGVSGGAQMIVEALLGALGEPKLASPSSRASPTSTASGKRCCSWRACRAGVWMVGC